MPVKIQQLYLVKKYLLNLLLVKKVGRRIDDKGKQSLVGSTLGYNNHHSEIPFITFVNKLPLK